MTTSSTAKSPAKDEGFTLIEALVAMAIVALAAVLAVPHGRGTQQRLALDAAAIDLASAMKSARATAMRTNTEQSLTIDTAAHTLIASDWPAPRTMGPAFDIALDTIRSEQSGPHAGRFRFYPDGSSTGGRVVLSEFGSRMGEHRGTGRRAVVTVDWLTGGARVTLGQ